MCVSRKLLVQLRGVEQLLPPDTGRPRPSDNERFIIYLADEFENSASSLVVNTLCAATRA